MEDGRVWDESRAMTQSGGPDLPALDIVTSTRKWRGGKIQSLLDECAEAVKSGHEPPFETLMFCVFESAQNVPNCGDGCGCADVISGRWEDGSPRRFSDVCQGRLARSQGWLPLDDLSAKFRQNSQDVWEAQFKCSKPSTEGMVLPTFSRAVHARAGWTPDPSRGPIFTSIDLGYVHESAVLWLQLLTTPVKLPETDLTPERVLNPGTIIVFDEVYRSGISGGELGDLAWAREEYWRSKVSGFRVASGSTTRRAARAPLTSCALTRGYRASRTRSARTSPMRF